MNRTARAGLPGKGDAVAQPSVRAAGREGGSAPPRTTGAGAGPDALSVHAVTARLEGDAAAQWVPAGTPVRLGRGTAPRGGLYVGARLAPLDAQAPLRPQACLIRPALAVDWQHPDDSGRDLVYWPSYSTLSPQARAGYLRWLCDGCQHPDAPVGFVFLYFYGLERRLLQVAADPQARPERDLLLDEIQRLLRLYGRHAAVGRYLPALTDAVMAVGHVPVTTDLPAKVQPGQGLPFPVKLALGRLVAQRQPVPAKYALAWWQADPTSPQLVAVKRCPTEFRELFAHLYRRRHGDGLVVDRPGRRLSVFYRAASPDLRDGFLLRTDAVDVGVLSHHGAAWTAVRQVVEETSRQLRPYSRLLSAHPDQADTPRAAALLPAALQRPGDPRAHLLLAWAKDRLAGVDASDGAPGRAAGQVGRPGVDQAGAGRAEPAAR